MSENDGVPEEPAAIWWVTRAARSSLISLVGVYQRTIAPILPFRCRFEPSCSRYFVAAVERFGIVRGVWLGGLRILRCQPLCRGGFDPIPDRRGRDVAAAAARSDEDDGTDDADDREAE